MHIGEILTAAVLLLGASAAAIIVSRRLGLGSILGLLAAGVLLGPHTVGPIVDLGPVAAATELGVVFLLFIIGLELEPRRLWAMRGTFFGLGTLQMLVTSLALMAGALAIGRPWQASLILGCGLALSSTAFVAQLLAERGELTSEHGRIALAILLFQDMAIVPLLALVPLLGSGGAAASADLTTILVRAGMIMAALGAVLAIGHLVLPRILAAIAKQRNREAFAVLAALAVLLAAWITHEAGLSPALGGFMMGVLLSRSPYHHQIAAEVEPYKGLLLGLFFISVGMSIDLGLFLAGWMQILAAVAALIILKGMLLLALCRLIHGQPLATALRASLLLTQGGEFGFVLFAEAAASGVMGPQLHTTALLVISISMAGTPLLVRLGERLARWLDQRPASNRQDGGMPQGLEKHVLIAGYGRVGQAVSAMLDQAGIRSLALDLDPAKVAVGQTVGRTVLYGDASDPRILEHVGAGRAAAIVITLNHPHAAERIVSSVRSLYPGLAIVARAHDLAGRDLLERLGAHVVVPETMELSIRLGEATLLRVGVDEGTTRDVAASLRQALTPR